jgi:hypothetical protein
MALFNKVIKNEESLQYLITFAGLVLFLISYGLAGLDWYLVAGLSVYMIILMAGVQYLAARKFGAHNRTDERTARMTQMASRSGYLAALLAAGAIAVLSSAGYVTLGLREGLFALFLVMVTVQAISYAYYLDRGLT